MTRGFALVTAALVVMLISAAGGAAPLRIPFEGLPATDLVFTVGGQELDWRFESRDRSSARYSSKPWRDGEYTLNLRLERNGIQKIVRFELRPPKGRKLSVDSYSAKITTPQAGLHSVMVPNIGPIGRTLGYYHQHNKWPENVPLYRCLLPQGFEEDARANSDAPFILLCDNKGNNGISAGWAVAERATTLRGAAGDGDYVLTLSRREDIPLTGESLEDALIISTARKSWLDVERQYAKTFDRFNGRRHDPLPEWTSEPVFCTWYCYLHNIDQKLVLNSARKCRELGIGTYLIDAGWDAKPGQWWGDLDNGILGDFIVAPDRFPDMPGAVKEMHDMGLRVELWSAPFWQARQSKIYLEKTKDWHVWEDSETYNLCPKYPGTRGLFKEQFEKLARTLKIDGIWIDVADSVPHTCNAKHQHLDQPMGNAVVDCLAAVRDALRSVNTQAITEARILHANINTKRALDIVQCGDSPESFEMIRLANLHMRPWAYDVVLKTDPTIWPKNSGASTVGKYMATMVCSGVPALSVDFLTATDEQCAITKAWLSFYREHRKTLLKGEFKLFGENYAIPDMMFIGDREAIVYMKNTKTSEIVVPRWVDKVILLNCTDTDRLDLRISTGGRATVQSYRPDWSRSGPFSRVDDIGSSPTAIYVPRGGAAVLEVS
ncbi:MAG: alpha-galactosidase [Armatimonadota bacterium]|nr:alpha-galactosidase [Armatimonadota bacterium]